MMSYHTLRLTRLGKIDDKYERSISESEVREAE